MQVLQHIKSHNQTQFLQNLTIFKFCNKKNLTKKIPHLPSNDAVAFFIVLQQKKKKKGLMEGAYLKIPLCVSRGSRFRSSGTPSSWARWLYPTALQLQARWLCSRSLSNDWFCSCSRSNNSRILAME